MESEFGKIYEKELARIVHDGSMWNRLKGKTVLLSGATGMIGKCLVDLTMHYNETADAPVAIIALSRNSQTAAERFGRYMGKETFRYISCDINDPIPECGTADYVIHAASNTHPRQYAADPIGTIASNVIGTKNLLDYAVSHGAQRFCFVSSVEIYGENRGDVEAFDEKYLGYLDCNTLRAGYPESKRLGETMCHAYGQTYGLEFVIPRLSRIYGPTMLGTDSKAVAQFAKKAAARENIVLKSEGNQKYSYAFETDAAAGILYTLLLGEPGRAYNVADRESDITLKKLAGILAQIAGTQVVFERPEETEQRGYSGRTKGMLDPSQLESLGWQACVHLQEGLRCTVESLRQQAEQQRKM